MGPPGSWVLRPPHYHFLIRGPPKSVISQTLGQGVLCRVDAFADVLEVHRVATQCRYAEGVALSCSADTDGGAAVRSLVEGVRDAAPGTLSAVTPAPFDSV